MRACVCVCVCVCVEEDDACVFVDVYERIESVCAFVFACVI